MDASSVKINRLRDKNAIVEWTIQTHFLMNNSQGFGDEQTLSDIPVLWCYSRQGVKWTKTTAVVKRF